MRWGERPVRLPELREAVFQEIIPRRDNPEANT
jgi:hypothetical protein